jgi:hypothetical protein
MPWKILRSLHDTKPLTLLSYSKYIAVSEDG